MAARQTRLIPLFLLVVGVWVGPPPASAVLVSVTADTSALAGTAAQLEFDLFGLDDLDGNNTALLAGPAVGAPVLLTDAGGLGQLLQDTILGNSVAFTVDLSSVFEPGSAEPDRFAFFLLDPVTSFSLVATDLEGDALLRADLVGGALAVFAAAVTTPSVPVQAQVQAVPGAGSLLPGRARPGPAAPPLAGQSCPAPVSPRVAEARRLPIESISHTLEEPHDCDEVDFEAQARGGRGTGPAHPGPGRPGRLGGQPSGGADHGARPQGRHHGLLRLRQLRSARQRDLHPRCGPAPEAGQRAQLLPLRPRDPLRDQDRQRPRRPRGRHLRVPVQERDPGARRLHQLRGSRDGRGRPRQQPGSGRSGDPRHPARPSPPSTGPAPRGSSSGSRTR